MSDNLHPLFRNIFDVMFPMPSGTRNADDMGLPPRPRLKPEGPRRNGSVRSTKAGDDAQDQEGSA
jgi:hypothetical protein